MYDDVTNVKLECIRYSATFFDAFLCIISCKSARFILNAQFSAPVFVETALFLLRAKAADCCLIFKKNVKKPLFSEFLSLCRRKLLVYSTEISYFHNIYRFSFLRKRKNTGQSITLCPANCLKALDPSRSHRVPSSSDGGIKFN